MSWSREFDEPIALPGRKLDTLRDAADYVASLQREEAAAPEWQAAIEALMLVCQARRAHADGVDLSYASAELDQVREFKNWKKKAEEGRMTVWVHHDTSKKVGDKDHLKVFANENAADRRFQENDPECVAFQGSGVIRTSAKDPRPSSVN